MQYIYKKKTIGIWGEIKLQEFILGMHVENLIILHKEKRFENTAKHYSTISLQNEITKNIKYFTLIKILQNQYK